MQTQMQKRAMTDFETKLQNLKLDIGDIEILEPESPKKSIFSWFSKSSPRSPKPKQSPSHSPSLSMSWSDDSPRKSTSSKPFDFGSMSKDSSRDSSRDSSPSPSLKNRPSVLSPSNRFVRQECEISYAPIKWRKDSDSKGQGGNIMWSRQTSSVFSKVEQLDHIVRTTVSRHVSRPFSKSRRYHHSKSQSAYKSLNLNLDAEFEQKASNALLCTIQGPGVLDPGQIDKGTVKIIYNIQQNLRAGLLPDTVSSLQLNQSLSEPIIASVLPSRLKHLCLNAPIEVQSLPFTLETLTLGRGFQKEVIQFPENLQSLIVQVGGNYAWRLPNLPDTIVHFEIQGSYNQALPNLPKCLQTLVLGRMYNHELPPLPNGLQVLVCGKEYNQKLPRLPDSLCTLQLGDKYNQRLPYRLPSSLRTLCFGNKFEYPIASLPSNLEQLRFSCASRFRHPLPVLPNNLISLHMPDKWNRSFCDDHLPETLQELKLGNAFAEKLPSPLPSALQKLHLGKGFRGELGDLPEQLVHLSLGHRYTLDTFELPTGLRYLRIGSLRVRCLPLGLSHLEVYKDVFVTGARGSNPIMHTQAVDTKSPLVHLPPSLRVLILGDEFTRELKLSSFPNSLRILHVGNQYRHRFGDVLLPNSMVSLRLGSKCNAPLRIQDVDSLKYLQLGRVWNNPLPMIPNALTQFSFGAAFNQPPPVFMHNDLLEILHFGDAFQFPLRELPRALVKLRFGRNFNHPLPEIPETLRYLELGYAFNQKVYLKNTHLEELRFGYKFNQSVKHSLPETLKRLQFGSCFNQSLSRDEKEHTMSRYEYDQYLQKPSELSLPNLTSLTLGRDFSETCMNVFPSLRELSLGPNFKGNLPAFTCLERLRICSLYPESKLTHVVHATIEKYEPRYPKNEDGKPILASSIPVFDTGAPLSSSTLLLSNSSSSGKSSLSGEYGSTRSVLPPPPLPPRPNTLDLAPSAYLPQSSVLLSDVDPNPFSRQRSAVSSSGYLDDDAEDDDIPELESEREPRFWWS